MEAYTSHIMWAGFLPVSETFVDMVQYQCPVGCLVVVVRWLIEWSFELIEVTQASYSSSAAAETKTKSMTELPCAPWKVGIPIWDFSCIPDSMIRVLTSSSASGLFHSGWWRLKSPKMVKAVPGASSGHVARRVCRGEMVVNRGGGLYRLINMRGVVSVGSVKDMAVISSELVDIIL